MFATECAAAGARIGVATAPFRVISKEWLLSERPARTAHVTVSAPAIAHVWQPGQFVIVRLNDSAERIPLTIAGGDEAAGTIKLVIQEVGKSTSDLVELESGDSISDVCGPLGLPSEIGRFGVCVVVAGGYGVAAVRPIAEALRARGNWIISILGARASRLLILEDELRNTSDVVYVATDDGSAGIHGTVMTPLETVFSEWEPDRVLAIGPLPMMRAVSEAATSRDVPSIVSLNPIMLDGTGMCGACRVHINGEVRFACVDGPEFDAAGVDFDELASRQGVFKDLESIAWEHRDG